MNPVEFLREEHGVISVELDELDFIMDSGEGGKINYSNLVHTFWKICELWDNHERMEEELFAIMKEENFEIPIEAILLEHKILRGRIERISEAINSGSDFEVRKVLSKEMREFVDVLRKHAEDEEDVLMGVIVDEFSEESLDEIDRIIGKYKK
jgi:hemerythrin-like domain-containing protein